MNLAVKCNDDPVLLRVLAFLNVGFDCASINEMKTILGLGVDPSRIIYAAPCKAGSHLRYAAQRGVRKTVFDNETELYKIEKLHPEAELYLRIRADEPSNGTRLADKFGASVDETHSLLALTKRLGLRLVGISFHVGSPSLEPQAFLRAVQDARSVYDEAVREGFTPQSIDVGGGFTNDNFESSAVTLSMALAREFGGLLPTVRFMGEPGRFIASEVFSLACKVIGVRSKPKDMIYINDGIYGNFLNALIEPPIPAPILLDLTASTGTPLQPQTDPKAVPDYIIWGRTCDGADRVI